jgi:hypothetical protein
MDVSRREFFGQFTAPEEKPKKNLAESERKHVVTIENSKAKFRVIYGSHKIEQPVEDLGSPDAIALEITSYPGKDLDTFPATLYNKIQYRSILEKAAKEGIPIFLPDIILPDKLQNVLEAKLQNAKSEKGLWFLHTLFAMSLGYAAREREGNGISRRTFVGMGLLALAEIYLGSQPVLLKELAGEGKEATDEGTAKRIVERFLVDLDEHIHPETFKIVIAFRNLIMGYKLKALADMLRTEESKPEIAIVVGAFHTGIEKVLRSDDSEIYRDIKQVVDDIPPEFSQEISALIKLQFDAETASWQTSRQDIQQLTDLKKKSA